MYKPPPGIFPFAVGLVVGIFIGLATAVVTGNTKQYCEVRPISTRLQIQTVCVELDGANIY